MIKRNNIKTSNFTHILTEVTFTLPSGDPLSMQHGDSFKPWRRKLSTNRVASEKGFFGNPD
jgi:hypothetical protein